MAEMIVKVKEPQPAECRGLRADQILFTYLHLAADRDQTEALMQSGCVAVAYETVTDRHGRLPLLAPMSEVAGRMSVQVGAHCLEKMQGGAGMLLGGVPGVHAAKVVVIGGGVSGTNAIRMAMGMEAQVYVIDKSLERLYELDLQFGADAQHDLLDRRRDRAACGHGRPRDRRRAGAGCRGAQADHARDGQADAAGLGLRRHRHRPGWLQRDLAADHPRRRRPMSRRA